MKDVFTVHSSALPAATRVAGFRGTEGLSRPYEFDIYLLMGIEGLDLDLADPIGAKATLEINREDGRPPFLFHGVFSAFELLHELGERSVLHAKLVPQLWQLTQTFHSRMFTNQTIPDVITKVLEDSGLSGDDFVLKLAGEHKTQEHVCQYMESNFDFISRWMEREGMYYYFEQGDSAERLVIVDDKAFLGALEPLPVRFYPLASHDVSSREALHSWVCKHQALPGRVRLKDYDYAKPTLDVSGSAAVSAVGMGEISVYGSRFFTPDDGQRVAKLRAEELLARQVVYRGGGTALYLRPGYLFSMEDHPRAAFDMKYLITSTEHVGNQTISTPEMHAMTGLESDRTYWVEVTAIPATVPFRAESKTAWPRIYGFENGLVDGPADSEYAQIDEMGRYNVKFKFDESDLKSGKATTWVRMLQPHGGNPEGFHFPLRRGTEVIFTFLGGDPDRPVISGVVPNAHKPSPITKSNYTRNIIQTGGRNRMEMEDKGGGQWMHLSTPSLSTHLFMGTIGEGDHNFILETQGTGHIHTHGLLDVNVEGTLTEDVTGNVTETYLSNTTQTVTGHKTTTVNTGQTETINAGSTQTIHAFSTQTIVGPTIQTITGPTTQSITGETIQNITGAYTQTFLGDMTTSITGEVKYTVDGGDVTWKIADDVHIECNEWKVVQRGEVSWTNFGNITHTKLTNSIESTMGTTTELMLGLKTEVLVGGKIELTVGAAAEVFVGAKAEIVIAAQYEMNIGPKGKFKIDEIDVTVGKLEDTVTKMETALTKLEESVTELKEKPVTITNIGIMIIA